MTIIPSRKSLGRYQIEAELGRGAMGAVFRGRDPRIDRTVAIKTIAVVGATPEQEQDFHKRFFREAQAAGRLAHPGIVMIFDAGEDADGKTPFIVMEYVQGRTLEAFVAQARPAVPASLQLVEQVAEALDYAHSQGIVHRDIKPANIMVTQDGRAKIADFGIAKIAVSEFTAAGQSLGTPAYMAPEQITGGTVDGRSDLFSLGIVLYWLLSGEKPFSGETSTALCFKVVYQDPVPVAQKNPALSSDHDYVVHRALAKDPNQRYQTGHEFALDLQDLREGRVPRSRGTHEEVPAERTVVQTHSLGSEGFEPLPEAPLPASPAVAAPAALADKARRVVLSKRGLVGILVIGLLAAAAIYIIAGRKAVLEVSLQHPFRSAQLKVRVDGEIVLDEESTGTGRRQGGSGGLSSRLEIPAGRRVLAVSVVSARDNYAEIKTLQADFAAGQARTLHIQVSPGDRALVVDLE